MTILGDWCSTCSDKEHGLFGLLGPSLARTPGPSAQLIAKGGGKPHSGFPRRVIIDQLGRGGYTTELFAKMLVLTSPTTALGEIISGKLPPEVGQPSESWLQYMHEGREHQPPTA